MPIVGTSPGVDPPGRGAGRVRRGAGPGRAARPGARHGHLVRRGEGDRRRDRLPGAGPPVVRARRAGHGDRLRRRRRCATTSAGPPTSRRTTRCWSTGSSTTPSRSTWTRSCDADGEVYLGGVMEHIEEAGIHSGDSSCALPPITLAGSHLAEVRRYTEAIARGVGVRGLLNVQYALKDDVLYVLEANPRASRTVPFVSKATAVPLAKAAARIALGATIAELRAEGLLPADRRRRHAAGRRADRGQGGGAAVQAVPHPRRQGRRLAARPGDEVDRRGDGHRHRLRARVRQVAGGRVRVAADRRAGSSSRWPTGTSAA